LPDFLAARLPGLLAVIDHSVVVASSAKSMEAAADALRGPDVSLPGAVRWLRRRIRAVRMALAHVMPETVIGAAARGSAPERDLAKGRVLLGLRRSLSPQILDTIPAPLGFRPTGRSGGCGAVTANTGWGLTDRPPIATVRWSRGTKPDGTSG
jgi:hypothetical protein